MSLPFKRPSQILGVDDVLPIEIVNRVADRTNDAREHLGVEHYVNRGKAGVHRVPTIPIAFALIEMPGNWRDALANDAVTIIGKWGAWARGPTWIASGNRAGIEFGISAPWYGVQLSASSTRGFLAFGAFRFRDDMDQTKGMILFPDEGSARAGSLEGAALLAVAVYGAR